VVGDASLERLATVDEEEEEDSQRSAFHSKQGVKDRKKAKNAPESRSVVSDLDNISNLVLHQNGADGETVGERLSHRNDVGVAVDGEGAVGPEGAGTTETALHEKERR
jgi:hypothetical protein